MDIHQGGVFLVSNEQEMIFIIIHHGGNKIACP